MHLGLTYEAHPKPKEEEKAKKVLVIQLIFCLIRYPNSNDIGDPTDKKSVIGHGFFIHRSIIS